MSGGLDGARLGILTAALVFYTAYLIKGLRLRRKGIQAHRLMRGEKPRRTRLLEGALSAATFGMGAAQAASIFLLAALPAPRALQGLGVLLAFLGTAVFIAAMTWMRDSWRAGVDKTQKTALVTGGIYRFSRNPAFVGFDLFYLGTAFALPNFFSIAGAAASILLLHLQIIEEEKMLPALFGQAYEEYRRQTRRYF